jgi:DNA-binding winged helix-turn-helix (wHTH) protein
MPKGLESRGTAEKAFTIGEWHVEPDFNLIKNGNSEVHLEIKVMELLVYLAHQGDRLVTRSELIDGVWGTEFICDNTLTHAVSQLRTALGDNPKDPSFIQTIHRRGYRLVAEVVDLEGRGTGDIGHPSQFRILTPTREIQLREGANLMGRAPGVTVRVDSIWVSRQHARVQVGLDDATIEDLGSCNGTYLNGERVAGPATLISGDIISLGKLTDRLRFVQGGEGVSTAPLADTPPDRTPHA